MRILVINGPNINMLGIREKSIYGEGAYEDLLEYIRTVCLENDIEPSFYQSNHEGAIVDVIQEAFGHYDGIVINPAAYTHTSIAILDALRAVSIPVVEVHLSDILSREPFRHISYPGLACVKSFIGMGFEGYKKALLYLKLSVTAPDQQ